jgi:hypothetical protein
MNGDQAAVSILSGWRPSLAGDKLLAALAGQAEAHVDRRSQQVTVNWLITA